MSEREFDLAQLDDLIDSVGLPVRTDGLVEAWEFTEPLDPRPMRGQVVILVTLRAHSSDVPHLESAAREFVESTLKLPGALGTALVQSADAPEVWFLLERFESRDAFERHMASDYFRKFQIEQRPLLAKPAEAVFLESGL